MNLTCPMDLNPDFGSGEHVGKPTLCEACAATKGWVRAKRLLTLDEAAEYLALTPEQVQWLVNTRQLTLLRIRGEDRFDSRDLDLFIDHYKQTALRRAR